MVAAVHFSADSRDEHELLACLLSTGERKLFVPNPMRIGHPEFIAPEDALLSDVVCVLDAGLGDIRLVRPPSDKFDSSTKRAMLNLWAWNRSTTGPDDGLVDWERTPAVCWYRGSESGEALFQSTLRTHASSMAGISPDYERWVKRTMAWIRRRGTSVSTATAEGRESEYDVFVTGGSAVYALPGALEYLAAGGAAREKPEMRQPPHPAPDDNLRELSARWRTAGGTTR